MGIAILADWEQDKMRSAGRSAAATLSAVADALRPGMSTLEIDELVRKDTAARGGTPAQLGYHGFPGALCTSRNSVVCHGIPSAAETIEPGDIINCDVTTCLDGYHGDTSETFLIGDVSPEGRHVVDVARRCRDVGIAVIRDGVRLGDIGHVIEELALREGCSVVRDYGGHGIGRTMHAPPTVDHTGKPGRGKRLRAGMCITVEPMINLGTHEVQLLEDDWTVVTGDGALSAQFEHTVLVTKTGHEILTAR